MTTRYAGKYRRSPCPQATHIKTFNFLRYLSLGRDVLASPYSAKKKIRLKKLWKLWPPSFKNFRHATAFMFTCICLFIVLF